MAIDLTTAEIADFLGRAREAMPGRTPDELLALLDGAMRGLAAAHRKKTGQRLTGAEILYRERESYRRRLNDDPDFFTEQVITELFDFEPDGVEADYIRAVARERGPEGFVDWLRAEIERVDEEDRE